MHRLAAAALCLGITVGLGGCRHQTVVPAVPPPHAPVEPVKVPSEPKAPLLETPQVRMPPIPIAAAASRPKREKKRPAKVAAAPAMPETAPAPAARPADANSIGTLTAGAPADPQTKQDATDLIAAIEKRLNALPPQMDEAQKAQISKVRNFWRDAQEALKSGDAEGAMTLATKAKLLLDDQQE